jgi:hypothetical protein
LSITLVRNGPCECMDKYICLQRFAVMYQSGTGFGMRIAIE